MAPRLLYSCVLIQLNISGKKSKLYLSIGCYYKLEIWTLIVLFQKFGSRVVGMRSYWRLDGGVLSLGSNKQDCSSCWYGVAESLGIWSKWRLERRLKRGKNQLNSSPWTTYLACMTWLRELEVFSDQPGSFIHPLPLGEKISLKIKFGRCKHTPPRRAASSVNPKPEEHHIWSISWAARQ